ncbi:MAG: VCBS repeat-containing protein [Candidatus Latescibacterota bacterium]
MRRCALLVLALPALGAAQGFEDLSAFSGTRNEGLYSTGVAWGDCDNDGDLDLYVTNWGTSVSVPTNALYENQGDGTFADVAAARGVDNRGNSSGAAWADYDNDGDLDLYVADFFDQDYLYENRDGSFVEVGHARGVVNLVRQGAVTCVVWGDYDGDGLLDFYLGKFYHDNELYHNEGQGIFRPVLDLGVGDRRDTQAATWVDFDNDGDLDLYVVNREQENALYRNDLKTEGTFTEVGAQLGVDDKGIGQGGAWGDYDTDGDLDLFVANVGANALYRNDGAAGFTEVSQAAGVRRAGASWITVVAAWADWDGDGDLDLYLATGGDRQRQPDVLFANRGDGTFEEATALAGLPTTPSTHMAAAWGDLDGTGSPDLYVTDGWGPYGAGNRLFRNATPGETFIRVQVRGKGPQAGGASLAAVGARVRLLDQATGTLRGYQQVLDASGAPLLFGAPAGPYTVEVRFPSRPLPVVFDGIRGGQLIEVEEP